MKSERDMWFKKHVHEIGPGDLVGYLGAPAMVIEHPRLERFIGALVEILCQGKKIKVPLGMIEFKRYEDEAAI